MFCIKSDVITLESIEMYGFVTVWTSMDDGPYWVILLMYGSHDVRHTSFRRLTVVNGTPRFWGITKIHYSKNPNSLEISSEKIYLKNHQKTNYNNATIESKTIMYEH